MAFLQFLTSDSRYYELVKENKFDKILSLANDSTLKHIKKIISFPSKEDIDKNLYNKDVAFISDSHLFDTDLLIVKRLPNLKDDGIKTTQQYEYNEDINSELYNKFGIMVSEPTVNFSTIGGFEIPKQEMLKTKLFIEKGLVQKNLSIFLGVSRSGKSFFAECLAGELKARLIILDLGIIICSDNPSKKLDDFFYYLEKIDNYVLLIDEIEKVADPSSGNAMSKVLIGKLLTILNNFNSESGFNIKSNFVIATANNILTLLEKNPEFINRFQLKYFVNYPDKNTFISVCDGYLKKMRVRGITGEDMYNLSTSLYAQNEISKMDDNLDVKYGKYASGEIKELVSNLLLHCEERKDENGMYLYSNIETLGKVLHLIKPQLLFAKVGVNATISASKVASFREIN
jgi:hypothetical protein